VNGDSANVTTSNWQPILSCQNGAVVVDVDTNERRNLQVVVRDGSTFSVLDSTITFGQIQNPNERIYRATSPFGIFDPAQFRHLGERRDGRLDRPRARIRSRPRERRPATAPARPPAIGLRTDEPALVATGRFLPAGLRSGELHLPFVQVRP
jgi:hypothetical protein